jgi:hypothetical protein
MYLIFLLVCFFSCSICSLPIFTFLQDQGLDVIAEGLDTLKNMAHDMNEVSCLVYLYVLLCNVNTR